MDRDVSALSAAAKWDKRMNGDTGSMSRNRVSESSQPRDTTVNHLGWDDVERENFEAASQSAKSLLSDLRACADPLERAKIVVSSFPVNCFGEVSTFTLLLLGGVTSFFDFHLLVGAALDSQGWWTRCERGSPCDADDQVQET
jgi:hypothetical protein